MPTNPPKRDSSSRVLEPIERISEILFGLTMVLTFTGALSVVLVARTMALGG